MAKKQLQLFLGVPDEVRFTQLLKDQVPNVIFLNDNVWPIRVDIRSGIEECESNRVYIYNNVVETLPVIKRKSGEIEGPTAGCVIQILRTVRRSEGIVLSGRIAVGYEDSDSKMRSFVSAVWDCVRLIGERGVVLPDGHIDKNYLVGRSLREAIMNGRVRIADRATQTLFTLAGQQKGGMGE